MHLVQEENKKVVLALSGGIDSGVSCYILQQKGYEVIGVTGLMFNSKESEKMALQAENMAKKIGIEHHILDLSDKFKINVTDYFIEAYKNGDTPNPCIKCNKHIKWGAIFDWAMNFCKADFYATGHYAKIIKRNDKYLLYPSNDITKDQIYYLFELTQYQLSKTIFPLSDYTKEEIKNIAFELGIAQKDTYKESQDICFIPKTTNTKKYLNDLLGKKDGDFVMENSGKRLGIHRGFYQYTIGQRKGIGIAHSEPLYVTNTDAKNNIVYVGTRNELYKKELILENVNLIEEIGDEFEAFVKIRNNMPAQKAQIIKYNSGCKIIFFEPVSAITKGQAAVFYDTEDGHLLGGGWI